MLSCDSSCYYYLFFLLFVFCFFFREISGHKISKFICMKNDDNKEYLAMSSAAVVVGILTS